MDVLEITTHDAIRERFTVGRRKTPDNSNSSESFDVIDLFLRSEKKSMCCSDSEQEIYQMLVIIILYF